MYKAENEEGLAVKIQLRRDTTLLKKFHRLHIQHMLRSKFLSRLVSLRILNFLWRAKEKAPPPKRWGFKCLLRGSIELIRYRLNSNEYQHDKFP